MKSFRARGFVISLSLIAFSTTTAQNTWIVAKDGSGQFTEIQPAIDAASEGDLILIRDGVYDERIQISKQMKVLGSGVGKVLVRPTSSSSVPIVSITSPSIGHVVLAGMTLSNVPSFYSSKKSLEFFPQLGAGGQLVVDDVYFNNDSLPLTAQNFTQVDLQNSSLAILQRVSNGPASYHGLPSSSPPAFLFRGISPVSLSEASILGNHAGASFLPGAFENLASQTAVRVEGSKLFAARTSCFGGNGINAKISCSFGGPLIAYAMPGSDGILATGSLVDILGAFPDKFNGGTGGAGATMNCSPFNSVPSAPAGFGLKTLLQSLIKFSGALPNSISGNVVQVPFRSQGGITGTAKPGSSFSVDFDGTPGDALYILLSDDTDYFPLSGIEGHPLFVSPGGAAAGWFPGGIFDSQGKASITFPVPNDATLVGGMFFLQGLVASPGQGAPKLSLTNLLTVIVRES